MPDDTTSKSVLGLVKQTFAEFTDDDCPRMAAALSYYTVFSLPALLVLIIMIAGVFLDPQDLTGEIEGQIEELIGEGAAAQVHEMIVYADRPGAGGILPTLLSLGALLFGATAAFAQLQQALNRAWEIEPDPEKGGVKTFLMKRVLSLGMILTIAFLLLVSLALSAAISLVGNQLSGFLPGGVNQVVGYAIDLGVSLALITLLFAAIFKILPDVKIQWRDVWLGAFVTAVLFVIGKFAIGIYLGQSNPGEAYGTAGSLAVILVWIYYSSLLLFLGVEFTQIWVQRDGRHIKPDDGAIRVVTERRRVHASEAPR